MSEAAVSMVAFWENVPALVTSRVKLAQGCNEKTRHPVIEYLRDLEALARSECGSRETVQVIASGRRLLGDKTEIAFGNGPFSRT